MEAAAAKAVEAAQALVARATTVESTATSQGTAPVLRPAATNVVGPEAVTEVEGEVTRCKHGSTSCSDS